MRLQSALHLGRIERESLPCRDLMKAPIHLLTGQGTKSLVDKPFLPFSLSNCKVRYATSSKCTTQEFVAPWFDEPIQLHHRKPSTRHWRRRKLWWRTWEKSLLRRSDVRLSLLEVVYLLTLCDTRIINNTLVEKLPVTIIFRHIAQMWARELSFSAGDELVFIRFR